MSADEPSPSKRKRVDSLDASEVTLDPVRSDIWYDDGNIIVLQAQSTQFKVYRGILAQSSPVFNDMFMLPQPIAAGTQLVDGCLVVHLFDDSAAEVSYVLRALSGLQRYAVAEIEMPFAELSAFLCLGRKYDIPELYCEAQRRLFREIPATLDAFDTFPERPNPQHWLSIQRPQSPIYLELVILARRTGLLSILPYAFYRCCTRYPAGTLINGAKRSDGSMLVLSAQDQLICLAGYRAMHDAQRATTLSWAWDPQAFFTTCTSPAVCRIARRSFIGLLSHKSAIAGLIKWARTDGHPDLCEACTGIVHQRHTTGRVQFWDMLPDLFGLPPWTELLK
ncbi:hypothetical protein HWV62_44141 [Athelia sp. TMB]|nr:hypothetical protein HWV62_44141 [Athelia sp. TMB]